MATKNILAAGIGFTPGSITFIVTRGLSIGAVAAVSPDGAAKMVAYAQAPATVIQDPRVGKVVQSSRVPKIVKK
jgi:hypothetical protein